MGLRRQNCSVGQMCYPARLSPSVRSAAPCKGRMRGRGAQWPPQSSRPATSRPVAEDRFTIRLDTGAGDRAPFPGPRPNRYPPASAPS